MSEDTVVQGASPTLAGIKTGSLFPVRGAEDNHDLSSDIRRMNRTLVPKGLRMVPVSQKQGPQLLYLYRPARLERDLSDPIARALLSGKGYRTGNAGLLVKELVEHFGSDSSFPHEVGLFLGYPAKDVHAFITHKGKSALCTGTWKAYGNEREAQERFSAYKRCEHTYSRLSGMGWSLSRLTVKEESI